MNRRSLLALGAGLVVGEPARRAYSFLNGQGLMRGSGLRVNGIRVTATLEAFLCDLSLDEYRREYVSDVRYDSIAKRITFNVHEPARLVKRVTGS